MRYVDICQAGGDTGAGARVCARTSRRPIGPPSKSQSVPGRPENGADGFRQKAARPSGGVSALKEERHTIEVKRNIRRHRWRRHLGFSYSSVDLQLPSTDALARTPTAIPYSAPGKMAHTSESLRRQVALLSRTRQQSLTTTQLGNGNQPSKIIDSIGSCRRFAGGRRGTGRRVCTSRPNGRRLGGRFERQSFRSSPDHLASQSNG